jgi:hypothetical protein
MANPHAWLVTADNLFEQCARLNAQKGRGVVRIDDGFGRSLQWDVVDRSMFLLGGLASDLGRELPPTSAPKLAVGWGRRLLARHRSFPTGEMGGKLPLHHRACRTVADHSRDDLPSPHEIAGRSRYCSDRADGVWTFRPPLNPGGFESLSTSWRHRKQICLRIPNLPQELPRRREGMSNKG